MKLLFLILMVSFSGVATKAEKLPDHSIYQLETKWTNSIGQKVELGSFQGKPVILAMVYFSCKMLCPTIVSDVQKIVSALDKNVASELQVVLISFDPKRDTPAHMRDFAEKRKLNPKQWHFITHPSDERIRELAVLLGFKYELMEDGEFSHSYLIAGLDRKGVVLTQVQSAGAESKEFLQKMNKI